MIDTGLTAVSLFSGVGGFDLALEQNGVKVVATCEIDKHAQKILTRHFPNTQLFTDVSTLTGEELFNAGFVPERGILTGGFPCQDVSVAGRRAGLTRADGTHTRSGLFWEVVRILEETKARYFVLENVPGLLTSNNGLDFATILCALQNIGYLRVAWRILDAQFSGVPQRRRRVFIVGSLGNDGASPSEILAIAQGRSRYLEASQQKGQKTSRKVGASSDDGGIIGTVTTAFGSKNYSNHQEVMEGSVVVDSKSVVKGEIVGTLSASDYKFPQQQQAHENKIVIQ